MQAGVVDQDIDALVVGVDLVPRPADLPQRGQVGLERIDGGARSNVVDLLAEVVDLAAAAGDDPEPGAAAREVERGEPVGLAAALGEAGVDELIGKFRSRSATKPELADGSGYSLSSVERLLRAHGVRRWTVQRS